MAPVEHAFGGHFLSALLHFRPHFGTNVPFNGSPFGHAPSHWERPPFMDPHLQPNAKDTPPKPNAQRNAPTKHAPWAQGSRPPSLTTRPSSFLGFSGGHAHKQPGGHAPYQFNAAVGAGDASNFIIIPPIVAQRRPSKSPASFTPHPAHYDDISNKWRFY